MRTGAAGARAATATTTASSTRRRSTATIIIGAALQLLPVVLLVLKSKSKPVVEAFAVPRRAKGTRCVDPRLNAVPWTTCPASFTAL